MRRPSVLTTRQPPSAVPIVRAAAATISTQKGTPKTRNFPPATNTRAITPIVFCASLDPCAKARAAEVAHSPRRTGLATEARAAQPRRPSRTRTAARDATAVEIASQTRTPITPTGRKPSKPPQLTAPDPASAKAAPASAPTKQCPELHGNPHQSVTRFQMSAPVRAAPTTTAAALGRSTIPATVVATATPTVSAPTTWNTPPA